MDADHTPHRDIDAVERQAQAWLVQLTSGELTAAQGEQFRQWCQDPAHREAFARARRQWDQIAEAGKLMQPGPLQRTPADDRRRFSRRAFLGAAIAAPASLAVVAALHPPLGLWPSVTAIAADFHTGTGERQRVQPLPHVQMDMDTRTSVRRRPDAGMPVLELVEGQVGLQSTGGIGLTLMAGPGKILADAQPASFDVRCIDGQVRVTCLSGLLRIEHPQGRMQLQHGQQVRFDTQMSGVVSDAVVSEVSAWTSGMLVFRRAPLSDVVDEINRYRRGRVVLRGERLAREPVSGRFGIDDPDAALEQLRLSLSLDIQRFPGGIAVLG